MIRMKGTRRSFSATNWKIRKNTTMGSMAMMTSPR